MSSTDALSAPSHTAGSGKNPRLIFINLPVSNVAASTSFYKAIGGTLNPTYSTEDCSCMVMSETIQVMIMTPTMFAGFCPSERDVVDAKKSVQVLLCMSVENREDVDRTTESAESMGGRKDPTTMKQMDGMYGRSFEDPDGHVWELMWIDPEYRGDSCPVEKHRELEEEAKRRGEKLASKGSGVC